MFGGSAISLMSLCFLTKAVAATLTLRATLWEAGRGPGGSLPTLKGKYVAEATKPSSVEMDLSGRFWKQPLIVVRLNGSTVSIIPLSAVLGKYAETKPPSTVSDFIAFVVILDKFSQYTKLTFQGYAGLQARGA